MEDTKEKKDLTSVLKRALTARNNPPDLKEIHIGTVTATEPVTVTIFEGKVTLTENQELFISEWFRFRCDINKEEDLTTDFDNNLILVAGTPEVSSTIPAIAGYLADARAVKEMHSAVQVPCQMPNAIDFVCKAIEVLCENMKINRDEILALKCELEVGDYVTIGSLAQQDRYILLDKVLSDVS